MKQKSYIDLYETVSQTVKNTDCKMPSSIHNTLFRPTLFSLSVQLGRRQLSTQSLQTEPSTFIPGEAKTVNKRSILPFHSRYSRSLMIKHIFMKYSSVILKPPFTSFPPTGGSSSSPPGINWSQWWTYDGISGPRFWGVINPAWGMCREGRRQSPINVDPKTLLFDPNLTPFTLDKVTVSSLLPFPRLWSRWRPCLHNRQ